MRSTLTSTSMSLRSAAATSGAQPSAPISGEDATRALFSGPEGGDLRVRVAETDTTNLEGRPFQAADGRVHLMDPFCEVSVDPASTRVSRSTPLDDQTRCSYLDPAFADDGTVAYATNDGTHVRAMRDGQEVFCVEARDAGTGEERWSNRFSRPEGTNIAEPVTDEQGNVYALTRDGTAWRFSPDGEVLSQIPTGQPFRSVNSAEACIDIDANGNICLNPNAGHFTVYKPSGALVADLESSDLFRDVDYIDSFSLSRDGTKAYVAAGAWSLAEVTLTGPASAAVGPDEAPVDIVQRKDEVDIGAVTLPARTEGPAGDAIAPTTQAGSRSGPEMSPGLSLMELKGRLRGLSGAELQATSAVELLRDGYGGFILIRDDAVIPRCPHEELPMKNGALRTMVERLSAHHGSAANGKELAFLKGGFTPPGYVQVTLVGTGLGLPFEIATGEPMGKLTGGL